MRLAVSLLCTFFAALAALAQTPAPCGVVTKAEVSEAVGAAVQDGVPNKTNSRVCDFKVGTSGSSVSILLTSKTAADSAARTVEALKKNGMKAEVVDGLGEGAYWSSPGYGMQQIGAFKGGTHAVVTVLILGGADAKSKEIAQKVMRKALARL